MKKILLAMMAAGMLFTVEAKTKTVSNGARASAVRRSKDDGIKKLYSKLKLQMKLYKKEKDKEKKTEMKEAMKEKMKELDTKLSEIDPKFKKLVDKVKAANEKAAKKE